MSGSYPNTPSGTAGPATRPLALPGAIPADVGVVPILTAAVLLVLQLLDYLTLSLPNYVFDGLSSAAFVLSGIVLLRLLRAKHVLIFTFALFFYYDIWIVWWMNYVFGIKLSSWRGTYFSPQEFLDTLKVTIVYATFFSLTALAASRIVESGEQRGAGVRQYFSHADTRTSRWALTAFTLFASGLALYAVVGTPRQEWLLESDAGDRFIVRASFDMVIFCFTVALFRQDSPLGIFRPAAALLLFTALVAAANGFRFILVTLVLIYFSHYVVKRNISLAQVFVLFILGLGAFFALLFFGYTRNLGMTATDIIAIGQRFDVQWEDVLGYVGAQQQANLVATHQYLRHEQWLWGQTFVDAIINILPRGLRVGIFDTIRPQDYIIETSRFLPVSFIAAGQTMGINSTMEGLINFGPSGPFIVIVGYVGLFALLERIRAIGPSFWVLYIAATAYAFSAAWYGSANFVKEVGFIWLIAAVYSRTCLGLGVPLQRMMIVGGEQHERPTAAPRPRRRFAF